MKLIEKGPGLTLVGRLVRCESCKSVFETEVQDHPTGAAMYFPGESRAVVFICPACGGEMLLRGHLA